MSLAPMDKGFDSPLLKPRTFAGGISQLKKETATVVN
jgi:hypothetical protein